MNGQLHTKLGGPMNLMALKRNTAYLYESSQKVKEKEKKKTGDTETIEKVTVTQIIDASVGLSNSLGDIKKGTRAVLTGLQKSFCELRQQLIDCAQVVGFESISQVLLLEMGLELVGTFQKKAQSLLQFYNQAITPLKYQTVDVKSMAAYQQPPKFTANMKRQWPFIMPMGTYLEDPVTLKDQQHGLELCVPVGQDDLVVISGHVNHSQSLEALPEEFQKKVSTIKKKLNISDDRDGGSSDEDALDAGQLIQLITQAKMEAEGGEEGGQDGDSDSDSDSDWTPERLKVFVHDHEDAMSEDIEESSEEEAHSSSKGSSIADRVGKRKRGKKGSSKQGKKKTSVSIDESNKENELVILPTRSQSISKRRRVGGSTGPKKASVEFKQAWLAQLSTQEIFLRRPADISKMAQSDYQLWQKMSRNNRVELVEQFNEEPPLNQAKMVGLLLSFEKPLEALSLLQTLSLDERLELIDTLLPRQKEVYQSLTNQMEKVAMQVQVMAESGLDQLHRQIMTADAIGPNTQAWAMQQLMELQSRSADDSTYQKNMKRLELVANIYDKTRQGLPVNFFSSPLARQGYLSQVERSLDQVTFGQKKLKEKLLQVMAKLITNPEGKGTALLLLGPPGTGKTTCIRDGLAKSSSLDFFEVPMASANVHTLGGWGFTWEGSQAGEIARSMSLTRNKTAVFFMDELDKIGRDEKAEKVVNKLIQMVDFSQNMAFQDQFIPEAPIDLSHCIFVFTANSLAEIHPVLLDRLTVLRTESQTEEEKFQIASHFQLPRLCKDLGLQKEDVQFAPEQMQGLLKKIPSEPGSRLQGRIIQDLLEKVNQNRVLSRFLETFFDGAQEQVAPVKLGLDIPNFYLPFQVKDSLVDMVTKEYQEVQPKVKEAPCVGEINGLYATTSGYGGILPIQFRLLPKTEGKKPEKGTFILTGSLGDVMLESIKVARTVAGHILGRNLMSESLHIHATETAINKDGPSAGVAITIGIISAITGTPIRQDVALTGEIDLGGNVTQIGGLREKLKGAIDAGAKVALVPLQNKKVIDELRIEYPRLFEQLDVKLVSRIEEALPELLVQMPEAISIKA